jgi:hypothetical protein
VAPLTYGLLGFVCGAVAWHFVGFWSTFHEILVRGPVRQPTEHHALAQTGPNCTLLSIDRQTGATQAGPCPDVTVELAEASNFRRDRLRLTGPLPPSPPTIDTSWTVTINDGAVGGSDPVATDAAVDSPQPPPARLTDSPLP